MKVMAVLTVLFMLRLSDAQVFEIKSIEPLSITPEESFYFPRFSPRGDQLILTKNNYQGLWLYRFQDQRLIKLNDYPGAGYEPVFLPGQDRLAFRTFKYIGAKRYYSLHVQHTSDKADQVLLSGQRNLLAPLQTAHSVAYMQNGVIGMLGLEGALLKNTTVQQDETVVFYDDQRIVVIENGVKRELQPFGPAIYVWVSLSPDQRRILFKHGTEGTFIADLNGNILTDLGKRVNAPRWSPDGNWITYMQDEDDGHIYTASDIYLISADGLTVKQLTRTDNVIEMYPQWSPDGKEITFHSLKGRIFLLTFQSR